ncbi:hypothetical protein JCM10212_000573 [Sporobolomyces blumeae]
MSRSIRHPASTSSFASTRTTSTVASVASDSPAPTVFRALNFNATIPVQVSLKLDGNGTLDPTIESYYVQVPRISYLALLVPVLKQHFLGLVLDDATFRAATDHEELWWFEHGEPDSDDVSHSGDRANSERVLKWNWPIGLLYDYHHALVHPGLPPASTLPERSFLPLDPSSPPSTLPSSLASVFDPLNSTSAGSSGTVTGLGIGAGPGEDTIRSRNRVASGSSSTLRRAPAPAPATSNPSRTYGSSPVSLSLDPWRITLHLPTSPQSASATSQSTSTPSMPPSSNLPSSNGPSSALKTERRIAECRTAFMARIKESDYFRWSSAKRVMGLRKDVQDMLWDGVVENDFEKYWSVASKLIPLPSTSSLPPSSSPTTPTVDAFSSPSLRSQTPVDDSTTSTQGASGSGATKNVPIRVYLPEDGGRSWVGPVPPRGKDGAPTTLSTHLSSLFPLLFPPPASTAPATVSSSSSGYPLVSAIVQGIAVPLEAEVEWLASCLTGTDGWVHVVVSIDER